MYCGLVNPSDPAPTLHTTTLFTERSHAGRTTPFSFVSGISKMGPCNNDLLSRWDSQNPRGCGIRTKKVSLNSVFIRSGVWSIYGPVMSEMIYGTSCFILDLFFVFFPPKKIVALKGFWEQYGKLGKIWLK